MFGGVEVKSKNVERLSVRNRQGNLAPFFVAAL